MDTWRNTEDDYSIRLSLVVGKNDGIRFAGPIPPKWRDRYGLEFVDRLGSADQNQYLETSWGIRIQVLPVFFESA